MIIILKKITKLFVFLKYYIMFGLCAYHHVVDVFTNNQFNYILHPDQEPQFLAHTNHYVVREGTHKHEQHLTLRPLCSRIENNLLKVFVISLLCYLPNFNIIGYKPPVDGFSSMCHEYSALERRLR